MDQQSELDAARSVEKNDPGDRRMHSSSRHRCQSSIGMTRMMQCGAEESDDVVRGGDSEPGPEAPSQSPSHSPRPALRLRLTVLLRVAATFRVRGTGTMARSCPAASARAAVKHLHSAQTAAATVRWLPATDHHD